MWKDLLERIQRFEYVVQRNWEALPEVTAEHDDLDLFVSEKDYKAVKAIADEYERVDVRHPNDGYYPKPLAWDMLEERRWHPGGFWIPSREAHFACLYYHNAVHKKDGPYDEVLKKLFLEMIPPVRCEDKGVGYFV